MAGQVRARTRTEKIVAGLRVLSGPRKGEKIETLPANLAIGRGSDNGLVLPDETVSLRHARLTNEGGQIFVEDLGSSNGTFVEGVRISAKTLVQPGFLLRFGNTKVRYYRSRVLPWPSWRWLTLVGAGLVVSAGLVVAFWPRGEAEHYLRLGQELLAKKQYLAAEEAFAVAKKLAPKDEEAQQGWKVAAETGRFLAGLADTEKAILAGDITQARSLFAGLGKAGRDDKTVGRLRAFFGLLEDEETAVIGQHWAQAARLLREAERIYPQATWLREKVSAVEEEGRNEVAMRQVDDLRRKGRSDLVPGPLAEIETTSVYYATAQQVEVDLERVRAVQEGLASAEREYQAGKIGAAIELLERIKAEPGSREALAGQLLLDRLLALRPLVEKLSGVVMVLNSSDPVVLREGLGCCLAVLGVETNSLNSYCGRARELQEQIRRKLRELASRSCAEAREKALAGTELEALKLYRAVLEIDADNHEAREAVTGLEKLLGNRCRRFYQQGLVCAELGQREGAAAAYRQAVATGFSGDKYHDLAAEKLRRLAGE